MRRLLVLLALAALPLLAEAEGEPRVTAVGRRLEVPGTYGTYQHVPTYTPLALTVGPSAAVAFTNADYAGMYATWHTLTSGTVLPEGAFDTGPVPSGGTVHFAAPAEPGRYPFYCRNHPDTMHGVLNVG